MATTTPPHAAGFNISSMTLRKVVGYLGLALPIIVKLGAYLFEGIPSNESISAYYYTAMRDVFTSSLFAIGIFLFFYRGYDRADYVATNAAGLAAVGIGLLPMEPAYHSVVVARFPELSNPGCYVNHGPLGFHFYAVAAFFALTSYMTMFQFTKTGGVAMTARKRSRNTVYIGCGLAMIGSFATVAYLKHQSPSASIFWPETIAIAAFALAWLTKGQAILKDT